MLCRGKSFSILVGFRRGLLNRGLFLIIMIIVGWIVGRLGLLEFIVVLVIVLVIVGVFMRLVFFVGCKISVGCLVVLVWELLEVV